jgi:hypothetical protein
MVEQVLHVVSTVKGVITYVIVHYLYSPQLCPKTGENLVLELAMHIRQGNCIMNDNCLCRSCDVIVCECFLVRLIHSPETQNMRKREKGRGREIVCACVCMHMCDRDNCMGYV